MNFELLVKNFEQTARLSRVADLAFRIIRSFILAMFVLGLWSLVQPNEDTGQLAITIGTFVISLALAKSRPRNAISPESLRMHLEMSHPERASSALSLGKPSTAASLDSTSPSDWSEPAQLELAKFQREEIRHHAGIMSSLVVPALIAVLCLGWARPSFNTVIADVKDAVSFFMRGASLKVVQGAATEQNIKMGDRIPLSPSAPTKIDLIAPNLIEVHFNGGLDKTTPTVELRRPERDGKKSEVFQSFQMMPSRLGTSDEESTHNFSVSIAISDSVDLYIPSISATKPLATIQVKQLPVPRVNLIATQALTEPWPDDQPISLQIKVEAENPIETIRLLIRSGGRVSRETVNTVIGGDKLSITTDYRLVLESYVESDLAEVEIVAEAVDRALPTPMVGQSAPLRVSTASAYGRYKQALQTLREIKTLVDEAISKRMEKLPDEALDLARKANARASDSPFFDGLDRVQIEKFEATIVKNKFNGESDEAMDDLSGSLNSFLFEHEILDDRERDRDFFVSIRGLSRLIEQERDRRPIEVKSVTERIRSFLDERQKRWTKRVEFLGAAAAPQTWAKIRDGKPFHGALLKVDAFDNQNTPKSHSEALTVLSKSVVEYRSWIEELEAKEDEARAKADSERQQGLASARDELKEIQKRQGEISTSLDRAAEKKAEDLAKDWPAVRMSQSANEKAASGLEGKLRSISPGAGARIKAAAEAMEQTVKNGGEGNFGPAETFADQAGRLLRQADQAAKQQQQQSGRDRGRRRRVTGDNYYGQSVVGGDVEIKREYQVDRRYREDILDEVRNSGSGGTDTENRSLLDNYLRQVIR